MVSQQVKLLIIAAALGALAYIVPQSGSFVVLLATRAMTFAILAMSVDLLLGYTGLSSMGQAAKAARDDEDEVFVQPGIVAENLHAQFALANAGEAAAERRAH